jgi:hypothetical protein
MANNQELIENLAAEIGDNIYIDVAKWHLHLNDAKLHTIVAQKAYSLLLDNNLNGDNLTALLRDVTVPLGGGRTQLSLLDLIPVTHQAKLMDILQEFKREI